MSRSVSDKGKQWSDSGPIKIQNFWRKLFCQPIYIVNLDLRVVASTSCVKIAKYVNIESRWWSGKGTNYYFKYNRRCLQHYDAVYLQGYFTDIEILWGLIRWTSDNGDAQASTLVHPHSSILVSSENCESYFKTCEAFWFPIKKSLEVFQEQYLDRLGWNDYTWG